MTIERIKEIGEDYNYTFHDYTETGKGLCGYEMETWTDGGVDMIHFIDLRDYKYKDGVTVENVMDQIEEINACFDVDEEIDIHREDPCYRSAFTHRQSVCDFEDYKEHLREFVAAVRREYNKEDGN